MSQQAIGRILLIFKGAYDSTATYNMLDVVRSNSKSWVCKQNNVVGIAPTEGATWAVLAQDGTGGTGSGDMTKTEFATNGTQGVVDTAITLYGLNTSIQELNYLDNVTSDVQTQLNNKVSDNPTFSEASTRANLAGSGESFATILGKIKKYFTDLKDLAFIQKDGSASKYLKGDGTWGSFPTIPSTTKDLTDVSSSSPTNGDVLVYSTTSNKYEPQAPSGGGHTMVANTPLADMIDEISNATATNDKVVSAYGIQKWSNNEVKMVLTTAAKDATGVGTWLDTGWESGTRSGWLWSEDLYHVLEDGSGNRNYDVYLEPVFDIGDNETVSLYAWRIDDEVTQVVSGQTKNGGAIAFKFNGAVQNASGIKVGVKIVYQRTEVNDTGTIIS